LGLDGETLSNVSILSRKMQGIFARVFALCFYPCFYMCVIYVCYYFCVCLALRIGICSIRGYVAATFSKNCAKAIERKYHMSYNKRITL